MYKLEPLTYDYDSLEPFIDTHTMGLHKNKHQKSYLDRLNILLTKNNYKFQYPINELIYHLNEFRPEDREDILYNWGGVVNHDIYFKSIAPFKEEPNSNLKKLIEESFGTYDNLKKEVKKIAVAIKGSGYVFLVINNGKLDIIALYNQQNPSLYNLIPLIALDMWEHAYYLNYKNNKNLYIDNFFDIVNFREANKLINYYIKK